MAEKSREQLKGVWVTDAKMTQSMFGDLFDSVYIKETNDGIDLLKESVIEGDNISIDIDTTGKTVTIAVTGITSNGLPYEKVEVEIVAEESTYASYSGTPDGCTTPVLISATVAGSAGNIQMSGDGIKTISQIIADYSNVTLTSGDGSQVPANKSHITLSGGVDLLPTQFEVEHTLNTIFIRVTISGPDFITNISDFGICQLSYTNGGKMYCDTTKDGPFVGSITNNGFTINIGTLEGVTTFVAGTYIILIEKLN